MGIMTTSTHFLFSCVPCYFMRVWRPLTKSSYARVQAGLFSAVLTAFVVVSCLLLKPDSTQTASDTLRHISTQIADSSLPAVAPAQPFHASTSSVWVNALWFVSLELSLASALFGMIAKRWLREYMTWTTLSSSVHDILSLRNYRYEAFLEWRVPSIIAAIPALLELALILFFAGLVLLLCTLNAVVAAVSTVTIGAILGLIVVTSVLPTLQPRCPYKTPIGWACAWIAVTIARSWGRYRYLHTVLECFPRPVPLRLRPNVEKPSDWRTRDVASRDMEFAKNTRTTDMMAALCLPGVDSYDEFEPQKHAQAHHLIRTLSCIRETSQDTRLWNIVDECWDQRVTSTANLLALVSSDFSFTSERLEQSLDLIFEDLDRLYDITLDGVQVKHASLRYDWFAGKNSAIVLDLSRRLFALQANHRYLVSRLAKMFAQDLNLLLSKLDIDTSLDEASARFVMRIAALVATLMRVSCDWTCAGCLGPVFSRALKAPFRCLPGLRATLFELLARNARFIRKSRKQLMQHLGTLSHCRHATIARNRFDVSCALLALQVADGDLSSWTPDDAHLFARISAHVLQRWRAHTSDRTHDDVLARLLVSIEKAVQISTRHRWRECGHGWIARLDELFFPASGDQCTPAVLSLFPHALVRALDAYRHEGLLGNPDHLLVDKLVQESRRLLSLAAAEASGIHMLFSSAVNTARGGGMPAQGGSDSADARLEVTPAPTLSTTAAASDITDHRVQLASTEPECSNTASQIASSPACIPSHSSTLLAANSDAVAPLGTSDGAELRDFAINQTSDTIPSHCKSAGSSFASRDLASRGPLLARRRSLMRLNLLCCSNTQVPEEADQEVRRSLAWSFAVVG